MAKKIYQHIDTEFSPDFSNQRDAVEITFKGTNSKGTETRITVWLDKYYLPGMVARITEIAKADASNAIRFVQRIKESVE